MYTFNSPLETVVGAVQNVGENDKVKDPPTADQFVPLFCVTPHFLLLLWLALQVFIILQLFFKEPLVTQYQLVINSKYS